MRQWLRKCTLIVGSGSGDALDLSTLRIKFSIKKTDAETPNNVTIQVFNLSDETAKKIQREFTDVILQAGYEENFGVIFRGNTKQVSRGRENSTDTFLNIIAGDGDKAYNFAVTNTTLAAGATQADQVRAAGVAMGKQGAQVGYTPDLGSARLPRGKVMYGMSRDYMRQSAETAGASWSIQDGKVVMVPVRGVLPGEAVLLTERTGLIGTPEQTNDGIVIKCLINPLIKTGGAVSIENSEVNADKSGKASVKIADNGIYKVLSIEYDGDTHGKDWYQKLTCVGIDSSAPTAKKVKGK
jgi:hypothetical protein